MVRKYSDPLDRPEDQDGLEFFEQMRASRQYSREAVEEFVSSALRHLPPGAFMQLWVLMLTNTQPAPGLTVARVQKTKNVMQHLYHVFRDSIPWMKVNILYAMKREICEGTKYNDEMFYGGMSGIFIKGFSNAARNHDKTMEDMGEFVKEVSKKKVFSPEVDAALSADCRGADHILEVAKMPGISGMGHKDEGEDEDGG